MKRAGRILRRILIVLACVVLAILLLVAAVLAFIETGKGQRTALKIAIQQVNKILPGLSVAELHGNYFTHLELDGIRLEDAHGAFIASVDRISLRYDLLPLVRQNVSAATVRIEHPKFILNQTERTSNLTDIVTLPASQPSTSPPSPPGSPWNVNVGRVEVIDGALEIQNDGEDVVAADEVNLIASFAGSFSGHVMAMRTGIVKLHTEASVPFGEEDPRDLTLDLSGDAAYDDHDSGPNDKTKINAALRAEIAGLAVHGGTTSLEVNAHGTVAQALIDVSLLLPERAEIHVGGNAGWVKDHLQYRLAVDLLHLDPNAILPVIPRGNVTLHVDADGTGLPPAEQAVTHVALAMAPSQFAGIAAERLTVRGDLHGEQWRLDELEATAPYLYLHADGHGNFSEVDADLVGRLRRGAKLPTNELALDADIVAHVHGRVPENLQLQASVDARSLSFSPVTADLLHLAVDGHLTKTSLTGRFGVRVSNLHLNTRSPFIIERIALNATAAPKAFGHELLSVDGNISSPRLVNQPRQTLGGQPVSIDGSLPFTVRDGRPSMEHGDAVRLLVGTKNFPLPVVSALAGIAVPLRGNFDLAVEVSGQPKKPTAQLELDLHQVGYDRFIGIDGKVKVDSRDHSTHANVDLHSASLGAVAVDALVPLDVSDLIAVNRERLLGEELHLTVDWTGGNIENLLPPDPQGQAESGDVTLHVEVQGSAKRPTAALNLSVSSLHISDYAIADLTTKMTFTGTADATTLDVSVDSGRQPLLTVRAEAAKPLLDLVAHLRQTVLSVRAQIADVRVQSLLVGALTDAQKSLQAQIGGDLSLDGTLAAPHAKADLVMTGENDSRLDLHAQVVPGSNQPLHATLVTKALSLSLFRRFIPNMRLLSGTLDVDLTAQGELTAPALNGHVSIHNGRVSMLSLPTFTGLELTTEITPERINLSQLKMESGGGTLNATAFLDWRHFKPKAAELHLGAKKFMLAYGGISGAYFDGGVDAKVAFDASGISGDVRLRPSSLTVPSISGQRTLQSTGALADVTYSDDKKKAQGAASEPATKLDLNLGVDPLRLHGKDVDANVVTKLELETNNAGQLTISGRISISHGHIMLFNREYEIDTADVVFNGSPDINPVLNVKLTHSFPDAVVTVGVTGTPKKPVLQLLSDPPIYERSQILALILTGQADNNQGAANSSYAVAGAVVSALASTFAQKLIPKIGLDVIRFGVAQQSANPSLANAQTNTTASVEVGKYITDRFYVGYERVFGATLGENSNEALLDYRLTRRLRVETAFGDAGVGGVDLFWTYRY